MRRALVLLLLSGVVLVAALLVPVGGPGGGALGPGDGGERAPSEPAPGGTRTGLDPGELAPPPPSEGLDPARCARAVLGRVRARAGGAPTGARVRVVLELDGEVAASTVASCDASGRFVADLPEALQLTPFEAALALVRFVAEAPGFRPARAVRPLAQLATRPAPDGAEPVVLVLDQGGRLFGRVRDERGTPVAAATVELVVRGALPGRTALSVADQATTRADGGFELGFVSAGEVALHARKDGVGSARLELTLEAGEEVELDPLVLRGEGTLAGHVRYPDGTPARRFELCAVPESLADRKDPRPEAALGALERERGRGLTFACTTSDDEGAFVVAGLEPGRYALVAGEPEIELSPRVGFASGASELVLVLAVHRLRVLVRDEDGRPLRGATVIATELESDGEGALQPGRAQHELAAGPAAVASFVVEAERPLALRALVPRGSFADEVCVLGHGEWEAERTLVVPREPPDARVRLDARDARGRRVPVAVSIAPAAGGLPVASDAGFQVPDEDGWLPPLPAGRWSLALRPLASGDEPLLHLAPARPLELELARGEERYLPVEIPLGARLELALGLPPGHELARPEPDEAQYGEQTRLRRAARLLRERGASASAVREGAEGAGAIPRVLSFEPPAGAPGGLEPKLLPGERAFVHEVLEPGAWRVRIEAEGFAPLEERVLLAAGEVRRLELALVALDGAR